MDFSKLGGMGNGDTTETPDTLVDRFQAGDEAFDVNGLLTMPTDLYKEVLPGFVIAKEGIYALTITDKAADATQSLLVRDGANGKRPILQLAFQIMHVVELADKADDNPNAQLGIECQSAIFFPNDPTAAGQQGMERAIGNLKAIVRQVTGEEPARIIPEMLDQMRGRYFFAHYKVSPDRKDPTTMRGNIDWQQSRPMTADEVSNLQQEIGGQTE